MSKYSAKIEAIKSEIHTNDMEAFAALVRFDGNIPKAINHIKNRKRIRHELARRIDESCETPRSDGQIEFGES